MLQLVWKLLPYHKNIHTAIIWFWQLVLSF
uniref:Uncharacterized protein n=1 Tax=Rhizophora mucronata TaxID=61149 RepID=A0A2P2NCS9_RHIMU